MPRSLRTAATRAVAAIAVILLGAGLMAAGAVAASGAARHRPVDHQLCYTASTKGFKIPAKVTLTNQFNRKGFKPKIGALALHCNPVRKTLPSGKVFGITNARAHLACFSITTPRQKAHRVLVRNQFGKARLRTRQPNLLCLPSWKRVKHPPRNRPAQPPGLSHFACYRVKKLRGPSFKPPPVMLKDEFTAKPVSATVTAVPTELCVPTKKTVGKHVFKIINPRRHLLCFPVTATPTVPKVFDKNQFGTARVTIGKTSTLCVPSRKRALP